MKPITKSLLLFFLLIILLGSQRLFAQAPEYSREVQDRITKVEQSLAGALVVEGHALWSLKNRMKYHNVPAVSIAVVKDFKIDWAKAYGYADLGEKRAANPATRFQAASISKSINAMALLKLVQDKQIDLHADVNQSLTSWKFPYDSLSKGKKISLANLLNHTAGLTVHGFPGYVSGSKIPSIVDVLNGTPPANTNAVRSKAEPGVKSVYSGGGTTVSQLMAMDLSKKPYQDFALEAVLTPLDMNHSFYYEHHTRGKASDLATAYHADGKETPGKYHLYPEMAAAALWTTPTDLAKFIIETQQSLQGKSNKVLSKEMSQLMLTPYLDRRAALGVFIENKGGQKYFTHGGSNEGFRSIYYGSMDGGNGVVIMVNSDNGAIMQEIINSIASVYQWKDFYKPIVKKLVAVADSISSAYVGKYEIRPQFILTITKENGQLKAQATGQGKLDLFPEAENKYFVKVANIILEFVRNESGMVDKVFIYQNGGKIPAMRI